MRRRVLNEKFFGRNAPIVAKDLIGKFLVRKYKTREIAYMVTETEAYLGPQDEASHARFGVTKRNSVMFEKPGVWYVYLIYGMHYMLNIITEKEGVPSAVLFRGVETASGPGRVTTKFHIGKELHGKSAILKNNLWLEDRGISVASRNIERLPRVGIGYAGLKWREAPLRFLLKKK